MDKSTKLFIVQGIILNVVISVIGYRMFGIEGFLPSILFISFMIYNKWWESKHPEYVESFRKGKDYYG